MISKYTGGRMRRLLTTAAALLLALAPAIVFAGGQAEEEALVEDGLAEREAPMLSALVEAGELPPVEERLPVNPKVIEPREEIGRYGGEARSALVGGQDGAWFIRTVNYDGLVVWNFDWTDVEPGAAASFEVSDDATEFTFELREGLRWHDGEPFTTADVEWWYEHQALNEDLTPTTPGMLVAGDEVAELEVIDETTFRFIFAVPNPLFLDGLASTGPWIPTAKHYGEQFHADFNEDIHDIAQDAGYDDWIEYYDYMIQDGYSWYRNPDKPSIRAWTPVEGQGYTGDVTVVRWERNPYYYRVDTEGNQLPYMDSWAFEQFEDSEVLLLRTLAGEIDVMHRHINDVENRPVLYDGKQDGDFRFFDATSANTTALALKLNMTHEDETVREIARNRDFRIGLSHAIDREEISELIHAGVTEPRQPAPHESTEWYHERLATQYTEFDQDLANEYFDRAGFEQDEQGRRIGPDGRPINIAVDVSAHASEHIDILEIMQSQLAAVGVHIELNVIDRTLWQERRDNNQHEATVWNGAGGLRDGLVDPRNYFPYSFESHFAPRWSAWYGDPSLLNAGVSPEEPPEAARRAMELYDELLVSPPDQHADLMYQIMEIAADEFWTIGTLSMPPAYGILHNRIGNGPQEMPHAWQYPTPGPADLSQFFIRD